MTPADRRRKTDRHAEHAVSGLKHREDRQLSQYTTVNGPFKNSKRSLKN